MANTNMANGEILVLAPVLVYRLPRYLLELEMTGETSPNLVEPYKTCGLDSLLWGNGTACSY